MKRALIWAGAPGCGKGTQAEYLEQHCNVALLGTGKYLRSNNPGVEQTKLYSDEGIIRIVKGWITENGQSQWISFDGVPRTLEQARVIVPLLRNTYSYHYITTIWFETSLENCKKRILANPRPGRVDDTDPTLIDERHRVYINQTCPMKVYLESTTQFLSINNDTKTKEETRSEILSFLGFAPALVLA